MSDLIFMAGGECLERYGTLVRHTTVTEDAAVETHTRSGTVGKFVSPSGVLLEADANLPRVDWLDNAPYLLLEAERTNLVTSDDLTAWAVTGTPVVTGSVDDPAGGTGAYTVEDDDGASGEFIRRTVTVTGGSGLTRSCLFVVRENTHATTNGCVLRWYDTTAGSTRMSLQITAWSDGNPTITVGTGSLLAKRYIGNGYWAIYGQTSADVDSANTNRVEIRPTNNSAETGSIDVYRVNVYDTVIPSFSILDASETCEPDTFYADFPHVPQEMTVYAKFIERGTAQIDPGGVIHIGGNGANTDPRFVIVSDGSGYLARHDNGTDNLNSSTLSAPSGGDVVELVAVLNADGSVGISQSLNGATATVATSSAASELKTAWASERIYINSRGGSNRGLAQFAAVKVARGTKTLAQMRAL